MGCGSSKAADGQKAELSYEGTDAKFRILVNDRLFEENSHMQVADVKAVTDLLINGQNKFTIEVQETLSDSKHAGVKLELLVKGKKKFKIECFPNRKNNNATTIEGTYEFAKLPGPSAKQRAKKENKAKS
ncbi:uncharacterized protein AMSG_01024 [Thecamonas trahens ATCC 50062]|uniref:Uncharacterized protein n=1 Tax=Thecamonas trahens ATCC 50062 TaxID=461836 RepID=A0A0L0DIS0_THETB|nr:hypothetical protein AMSG_01024 [Thecamonas trahens ATCC 50062]KNC52197.1 hypothetical protein AMSG_01024 [Thecamonas trahens ATCC 50062]|eukprot:XP_013762200.1 hypothetical protein AMSG_01024 [Thecamonas trahens ATCC 50062]